MDSRPDWGRGRIDPLNPFKFRQLRQKVDDTIGNSDMTPLWALGLRDGRALHWDGLNSSLQEVLVSSAIGNGASRKSVDLASLERVGEWLKSAAPPPFPFAIDRTLAAEGERVFAAECSRCHAPNGERMGQVIPIDEIGTDRHRLDTWTESSAAAFNATAFRGVMAVQGLQEDRRLRGDAARRDLAQRAVSAQRLGADAERLVESSGAASVAVLSRLRRDRFGWCRFCGG